MIYCHICTVYIVHYIWSRAISHNIEHVWFIDFVLLYVRLGLRDSSHNIRLKMSVFVLKVLLHPS